MQLLTVSILVYLLNIPFGYWRENVRKFSLQWILAIHIPVPIIVILRIYGEIGFQFITYPVMIGAFFMGQLTGSYIMKQRSKNEIYVTSCLIMDFFRSIKA